MRKRRLLAAAALLAGLVPVTARANATGLSVAPAHVDPSNPATRSYFIESIAAGGSYDDQVHVTNGGAHALHLYVSSVDGRTGVTSGAVFANRQDPVTKWGAWVTPAVSALVLAPGADMLVPFAVRVPPGASPGDHLAGIAFEDAEPATTTGSVQVTTVYRAVVGVLVKVPGPAAFHVRLYDASIKPLTPGSHLAAIVIRLGDDGLLLGKPRVTVTLDGPGGYHKQVTRQLDTLLPGDTIPFPFPWPESLAAGTYTVSVSAIGPGMSGPSTLTRTVTLGTALQGVRSNGTIVPPVPGPPGISAWQVLALILVGLLALAISLRIAGVLSRPAPAAPRGVAPQPRLRRRPSS